MYNELALFSLLPLNDNARGVVHGARNIHYRGLGNSGEPVLDIGHIPSKSGKCTLVTIGREGDITVEDCSIAGKQCSFEINLATGTVMLYDRSHNQSTQFFGPDAVPLIYGPCRKGAVQRGLNTEFGFGGRGQNNYQFRIVWYVSPKDMTKRARIRDDSTFFGNPMLARTIEEANTENQMAIGTPESPKEEIKWAKIDHLGSGSYGDVCKAVDIYNGKIWAIKILKQHETQEARDAAARRAKQEVTISARLNHKHIINYVTSQGWEDNNIQIFMDLKDGDLASLAAKWPVGNTDQLGRTVLFQMLQAIDYLATQRIIHRDVKPENILYSMISGEYHLQLADFGLSEEYPSDAAPPLSFAGTALFAAPETEAGGHTHKADVWSLYVTMLWTVNSDFRCRWPFLSSKALDKCIRSKVESGVLSEIWEMVRPSVNARASAAQMLVKCFLGMGLSTSWDEIEPLSDWEDTIEGNLDIAETGSELSWLDFQIPQQADAGESDKGEGLNDGGDGEEAEGDGIGAEETDTTASGRLPLPSSPPSPCTADVVAEKRPPRGIPPKPKPLTRSVLYFLAQEMADTPRVNNGNRIVKHRATGIQQRQARNRRDRQLRDKQHREQEGGEQQSSEEQSSEHQSEPLQL